MKKVYWLMLILSACNVPDFQEFSELGELRMMGIVADKPEIDGTLTDDVQVVLTPYLSDILGGGRKFNVSVASCLDPGLSRGARPRCLKPQHVPYPNGNSFDTSVLAENNYTGAMDAVTITIANPAQLIATHAAQPRYNGIDYLVIFRLTHDATNLIAVKAISIAVRETLNRNPEIEKIVLDEELASSTLKPIAIDVSFTSAGQQESYTEMSVDGSIDSLTESYFITWFYRRASIKPARILFGQQSKYQSSPFAHTVVAVVKDKRGGTAIKVKQLPASARLKELCQQLAEGKELCED